MPTIKEFSAVHDTFQAILERELKHKLPMPPAVQETLGRADGAGAEDAAPQAAMEWLGLLDLAVPAHLLRNHINETGGGEGRLRALIRFLVRKKTHTQDDRDKADWLVTHLFSQREQQEKYPTGWPKSALEEILKGFNFPALSHGADDTLREMPALLDEVKFLENFTQITDSRIIQRARDLKNRFGEEFFHPDVLAAVVNYNLFFGRRFQALLQQVTQQVRAFAHSGAEAHHAEPEELLQSDYRQSAETIRRLGGISRQESGAVGAAPAELVRQGLSPEEQLKQLGVNVEQETLYLRNRTEELTMRLRSNPTMNSVPNSFAPLLLWEWEAAAFRSSFPESEQSFRGDFARVVCRAIAIIYRIYDEIPQYLEKKSTEYLWKRHYDSLVFLLYEGRKHKDVLTELAGTSVKRGLPEKAKQLQSTAEKLETSLGKVAELF